MYVEDWETFAAQSEALFRSNPTRTRYVMKYRHCDGKLVLKVTDDVAVSFRQRGS
jgi:signal recognition particle subunit SRP9